MRPRCVRRGLGQPTCDTSSKLKVWYESLPLPDSAGRCAEQTGGGEGGELEERPCLGLGWRTEALRRRGRGRILEENKVEKERGERGLGVWGPLSAGVTPGKGVKGPGGST